MNVNTVTSRRQSTVLDIVARRAMTGLIALLLAIPAAVAASDAPATSLSPELEDMGWRLLEVPGRATAEFRYGAPGTIDIEADNAVAFLYRPVDEGIGPMGRLAWTWRVDKAVPATDLSTASGDDRSLAVHLVFPVDDDEQTLWESLGNSLNDVVASPLNGKVLTYVWGGDHPAGTVMVNPYFETKGRIIVLRNGNEPPGRWVMEDIDFEADFEDAFGYAPPPPIYVAISSDSDDTNSQALGAVADLMFKE